MDEPERRPPAPSAPRSFLTPDERADKRVGSVLVGKYRLEAVLGVGGMAAVYRASHRNGNRVAIKMLHAEVSADPDLRARFVREGYVANAIPHEGTVRVLDDDVTEDGAAFLVMDLLAGETLLAYAARHAGKLPVEQVVAMGDRILSVLVASHAAGVVHRDIKPENLFLTTEGDLRVLDFGVARMRDPTGSGPTRTGSVMGTPGFMPPEQALGRGKEIDERSDLWAVGATMWTLITSRYVHDGQTPEEVVVKTATQPARPLVERAPHVPATIAAVVDRALAFHKKDRFASAREMQAALETAAAKTYGAMPLLPKGSPTLARRESIGHARTIDASSPDLAAISGAATAPAPGLDVSDGDSARRAPTRESDRPREATMRKRTRWLAIGAASIVVASAIGWRATHAASSEPTTASSPPALATITARCAKNAECAAKDATSVCRKDTGVCVSLMSPDCTELLAEKGDVENDATIWIGAMIPRRGPDGVRAGQMTVNTLDLARRDFVAMSSGVPGPSPTAPPRPIAIVLCDDRDEGPKVAHHLVDDVGVPAVIGFGRTKTVMDLTPALFNAKRVLALAALNNSPILTSVPTASDGARFLWRPNNDSASNVIAISKIASAMPRAHGRALKAAIVRLNNAGNTAVGDALVSQLRADAQAELATFLVNDDDPDRDVPKVAAQVIAELPDDVMLLGGGNSFVPALVVAIEKGWPTGHPRPRYMSGGGNGVFDYDPLTNLLMSSPELRDRVFATDTPSSLPANIKLALHYNEIFTPPITPATTFGAPYDAFYLLAYAIVAAGDSPIDGESLTRALARLMPPGEPLDVGPTQILSAYNTLRAGKNVDLNGTTTTLDFDSKTGDPLADIAIFCARPTADHKGIEPRESGFVLDGKTQEPTGKIDCH